MRPKLTLIVTSVLATTACPGLSVDSTPHGWRRTEIQARLRQFDGVRIAAGSEAIVVAASDGNNQPRLWVSSDGATWERVSLPGLESFEVAGVHDIAWNGDRFVAVGVGTTGPEGNPPNSGPLALIYESPDGKSWRRTIDADLAGFVTLSAIEPTSRGLVAVGGVRTDPEGPITPTVWISAAGGQWHRTLVGRPGDGAAEGIVEFGRTLVVPGGLGWESRCRLGIRGWWGMATPGPPRRIRVGFDCGRPTGSSHRWWLLGGEGRDDRMVLPGRVGVGHRRRS